MKQLCAICKRECGYVHLDLELHQYTHRECSEMRDSLREQDRQFTAGERAD